MSGKKALQNRINSLTQRAVGAETHAELLEQALVAARANGTPSAPAAPAVAAPAVAAPAASPPSMRSQLAAIKRSGNALAAIQFALVNEREILAEVDAERFGGAA
jgi:hypothetical protein